MGRLQAEQIVKMDRQIYGRMAGGYLEVEYAVSTEKWPCPFSAADFLSGWEEAR
jgi:hypothetical protein